MGWNGWDCYGTSVTEAEVLADARFMAQRLPPFGWDTIVVDIQWYEPTARAGGYNADAPLCLDDFGRALRRRTGSRRRLRAVDSLCSSSRSTIWGCVSGCT
jgi:hypothetical protein